MDEQVFRYINASLKNPWLDAIMPSFSDKDYVLIPGAVAVGVGLYFGRRRTRACLLALLIALAVADFGSAKVLKNVFQRQRPYVELREVNLYRGEEWSVSDPDEFAESTRKSLAFPSSHASNIAAFALCMAFLQRKTLWLTLPLALCVGFSRIYTGHHYPLDVVAGYSWGALVGLVCSRSFLKYARQRWGPFSEAPVPEALSRDRKWLLVLLGCWTLLNFGFVHLNEFGLSGDEAQYWDWSRHLALGYYSKPPLVAYAIALLTAAGGNSEWAIRSGAVLLSSGTLIYVYAVTRRIAKSERTALLAVAVLASTPVIWAGSVLMTPDPLLCFFWAASLYYFHCAQQGEREAWWLLGAALGLGLLAKYTMALFCVSLLLYLLFVRRDLLRTRGPYTAAAIAVALMAGVIYWNWRHDWVSFRHTAAIGAGGPLTLPGLAMRAAEFVLGQAGVISPILFVLLMVAIAVCVRRMRRDTDAALLAWSSGVVLVFYAATAALRSTEPNWPVCAYIAAAPALALVWRERPRAPWMRRTLIAGIVLGCAMGIAPRVTGLLYAIGAPPTGGEARIDRLHLLGLSIRPDLDPTNALVGGRELGRSLSRHIQGDEADPPFVFSDRYQLTALAAFYTKGRPRTYCVNIGDRRQNHYDLLGGWEELTGRNGLFVTGGNRIKAAAYLHRMVEMGAFDRGEIIEVVEVRRGATVVKTYSIGRLYRYSGLPWPEPPGRY